MTINIVTDLVDPRYGSEFQVALKAIKDACEFTERPIAVWTLERAGNITSLEEWLELNGLCDRVCVRHLSMRFADEAGNHPTKIHFIADLLRLFRYTRRLIPKGEVVWKCGQVNALFYWFYLSIRVDNTIVGPISGFEYPPLISIIKQGRFRLFGKYALYAVLIWSLRVAFKHLLIRSRRVSALLFATMNDLIILENVLGVHSHKTKFLIYSEVDLDEVLQMSNVTRQNNTFVEKPRILWSGALIERKNPRMGMRVVLSLKTYWPDSQIDFIGDGPLRDALYKEYEFVFGDKINYYESIDRYQFISSLPEYNIVVVSTWREVNSVFVMEALSSNCLVISPNISGMKHTISDVGIVIEYNEMMDDAFLINELPRLILTPRTRSPRSKIEELRRKESLEISNLLALYG